MLARLPFRLRLFAATGLVLVAVAVALTASQAALMRASLNQQLLAHAAEQKPFVIAAFAAPLVERDFASIQAIIREAVQARGLAHLAVTDARGNVIASQGWKPGFAQLPDGQIVAIEGEERARRMSFHAEIRIADTLLGHAYFGLSYEPVVDALAALLERAAVVALISLAFALLLMEIVHGWLMRPLAQLARASERIRDGTYDFELVASTKDELGALTDSFRVMSNEIRERMRRLTESQEVQSRLLVEAQEREQALLRAKSELATKGEQLAASLTELRVQEQKLARALEHEREIAQQQRRFVSVAAHEFRTPLTIIDGAAQRIARYAGETPPEELRERAGKIRAAVTRMSRLIGSTLDSARAGDGSRAPIWSKFDLAALVHRICERNRMTDPAFALHVDGPPDGLSVEGDERLLERVFAKLISNALKYAGADRRVAVALREVGDHVEVAVSDTGIGIPAADLPQLFGRFFRASNAQAIAGTGLGLSLAHDIVALHGGTIAVVSRVGEGSTFTVRLPIRCVAPAPDAEQAVPPVVERGASILRAAKTLH